VGILWTPVRNCCASSGFFWATGNDNQLILFNVLSLYRNGVQVVSGFSLKFVREFCGTLLGTVVIFGDLEAMGVKVNS